MGPCSPSNNNAAMLNADKSSRGDRPARGGRGGNEVGMGMRSTSWRASRLKPVVDDFGFVSKGDNRLLDPKNQEKYYATTVEKYIKFCGTADSSTSLDVKLASAFASLTLTEKNARFADSSNAELSSLLLSMRKLREGVVASGRVDAFTYQVYVFIIRAAILMKNTESYHPALLHLLRTIHPVIPLSATELQEFAGYYMLHLACHMENYSEAFMVKEEFGVRDYRITQAIIALIHGNYWSFRVTKRKVDLYKGRLLEDAERRMRVETLKCLGKTYFTLELKYLETVMGMGWEDMRREFEVGWELDESRGIVTVRRQKGRSVQTNPLKEVEKEFKAWED